MILIIKSIFFWILLFFLSFRPGFALVSDHKQDDSRLYSNMTYNNRIKTVMLYREGWRLSYPFIKLNSNEKLIFSFDELTDDIKDYSYIINHCSADWQPSDISISDYLEGFDENRITDINYSINTLQQYVHYSLKIPNENIKLTLSGNYVIRVYDTYEPDSIIITRRFSIVEHLVDISGRVKFPDVLNFRESHQKINFTIHKKGYYINDPDREIVVVVNQNNYWFNNIQDLKPQYINDDKLIYEYDEKNLILGGNEFRHFDIKGLKIFSDRVKNITFNRPYYDVFLYDDIGRKTGSYELDEDINGKYFVKNQHGMDEDSDLDADYVNVHFTLPRSVPNLEGNIYIYGALSDWNFSDLNKMTYNFESKSYEHKIFLKQGYYNYMYVFINNSSLKPDFDFIEGSYSETENDYLIYVYHSDPMERYDKLIGFEVFNSKVTN